MAKLSRIGLSMCPSCGVFACDRCWTRAGGPCPGCGVAAAALAAGVVPPPGSAVRRRRLSRRAPIAVSAAAVVVATLAFVMGRPLQPTGGVEGLVGTPAPRSASSVTGGQTPSPLVGGVVA
ncbi:MAG TPA: hypothetical protein VNM34_15650, partial [Verrucomicrobiae bacterium]|nr:hypothetical protein [Verrucomicrobiae bacterium]